MDSGFIVAPPKMLVFAGGSCKMLATLKWLNQANFALVTGAEYRHLLNFRQISFQERRKSGKIPSPKLSWMWNFMEVAVGLEPTKIGFAGQRLDHFGIATPEKSVMELR
jgi:hypothetical protein